MRSLGLWGNVSRKNPGSLARLTVRPFRTGWATTAQKSLVANLEHVDASLLGDLLDMISLQRHSTFSWVKSSTEEPIDRPLR